MTCDIMIIDELIFFFFFHSKYIWIGFIDNRLQRVWIKEC